jgi:hippurate hydrolase
MMGVRVDVDIPRGVNVTANTPAEAALAAAAAAEAGIAVRRDMAPAATGEDFSWYLHERPGAFAWIGNGPAEPGKELHNPGYDYNDAILPAASGWLASVAKKALAG